MPETTLFTIGHSNHAIDRFINLLQHHDIELLVDVRSQPYSRRNPQFNRETLAAALTGAGIAYIDLGHLLGGRPNQADLYQPGSSRPDYEQQRRRFTWRGWISCAGKPGSAGRR